MEQRLINLDGSGGRKANIRKNHWFWLVFLVGLAALLGWALVARWPGPVVAEDLAQRRSNTYPQPPRQKDELRQTFTAVHDGFYEVEVSFVRTSGSAGDGSLALRVEDAAGEVIAAETLSSNAITHNQRFFLRFEPQQDSGGREYHFFIGGSEENNISLWAYDLDVYAGGKLTAANQQPAAEDLMFVTRYQLSLQASITSGWQNFAGNARFIFQALALILLPGTLFLLFLGRWLRLSNAAAWWGIALALGLSLWPVLWSWLSLPGGRWSSISLWAVLIGGWLLAAVLYLFAHDNGRAIPGRMALIVRRLGISRPSTGAAVERTTRSRVSGTHLLLLVILVTGFFVRLIAVRDQAFPPWVDASRHALITSVMTDSGQVIEDYRPLLPVDRFPYHYGFHTISAALAIIDKTPLQQQLLILSQLLNALVPLSVYGGIYLLSRRVRAALIAAFLVAVPFFFPGYYATWGRMTQLAAMLILPPAVGLTWRLVRGAPKWRMSFTVLGILVAGLFFAHFRVFLVYLPFAALVWVLTLGRRGRWLLSAAGLSLLLAMPRLLDLGGETNLQSAGRSIAGYNDFPYAYLNVGWEKLFLVLVLVTFLAAIWVGLRRQVWAYLPLFLGGWMGAAVLLLAGDLLGLPETWVINLNSAYITFFFPFAAIIGVGADRLFTWMRWRHWIPRTIFLLAAGALAGATLLFGLRQQVTILNPQTLLAYPADLEGLTWLKEHVPSPAKVAVNSWQWLGTTWTGSDGGAWVLPVTGLSTTTPPADYIYSRELAQELNNFNKEASQVGDWSAEETASWLRSQGVSHIYVGVRGGFFDPAELARNPALELVYSRDGVFIFQLSSQ